MFQIPTRETIGVQLLDGGIVNEIPVGQKLDFHVLDALGRRLLESQLGAFEDKLVVLVMAVHEHDLASAVLDEAIADIAGQRDDRSTRQRSRARQVEPAAAALLGTIAEIDGRAHDTLERAVRIGRERLSGRAGHGLGKSGVHAHGHMAAMLFERTNGDEDDGILRELLAVGKGVHLFHEYRVFHSHSLKAGAFPPKKTHLASA